MPFGSETELVKVAKVLLKAKLVFWIATNDSKAVCHLSINFGAKLKTRQNVEQTKDLNIDIICVS